MQNDYEKFLLQALFITLNVWR